MRTLFLLLLATACSKSPTPAATPEPAQASPATPSTDWIADAVEEALYAELMPGTTEEPDLSRVPALETFFRAHPEYADPDKREALWAHACGMDGAEAAHAFLTKPPAKTPSVVEVEGDDWKVFVVHTDAYCTSDDFGYYAYESSEAARSFGAVVGSGRPTNDAVVVMRDGKEVARIPLDGMGYTVLKAGGEPEVFGYGPDAQMELERYFGPETDPELEP